MTTNQTKIVFQLNYIYPLKTHIQQQNKMSNKKSVKYILKHEHVQISRKGGETASFQSNKPIDISVPKKFKSATTLHVQFFGCKNI